MGKFNLGGLLQVGAGIATGNPALAISGAGSILAGRAQDKAIDAATGAQVQSAQIASDTQLKLAADAAARQTPFVDAGLDALTRYQELLGLVPVGTLAQQRQQRRLDTIATTVPAAPVQGTRAELLAKGYTPESLKEIRQGTSDIWEGSSMSGMDTKVWTAGTKEQLLAQGLQPERLKTAGQTEIYEATRRPVNALGTPAGQNAAPPLPSGGPAPQPQTLEDLIRSTPGYNFAVSEEERALNRAAASRGQRLGGNVLEELASRAGNRALGTVYNDQLSRLAGLASMGQGAASGQSTGYMNIAGNLNANQAAIGSALSAGQLAQGANRVNDLQGLAELVANKDIMGNLGNIFTGGGYTGGTDYGLGAGGNTLNLGGM